jgi:hypothetical protein
MVSRASIEENSVWQGTFHQVDYEEPYPMVLFVNSRTGDTFEGKTWYPTLRNGGLITLSGQINPDGTVTFTEDEVLYGGPTGGRGGVVSGGIYTGSLEGNTLKGSSTIYGGKAGDFVLTRAD